MTEVVVGMPKERCFFPRNAYLVVCGRVWLCVVVWLGCLVLVSCFGFALVVFLWVLGLGLFVLVFVFFLGVCVVVCCFGWVLCCLCFVGGVVLVLFLIYHDVFVVVLTMA